MKTARRVFITIFFFLIGFGLIQALIPANHTGSNPAAELAKEVLTPTPADAAVGFTNVGNESSRNIKIACSYGGTLITLSPGQHSMMSGKCTTSRSDTDQILTSTTQIMIFAGPLRADGCYRIAPSIRAKIPDLSVATIYNLSRGCRGKTYQGYWTMR